MRNCVGKARNHCKALLKENECSSGNLECTTRALRSLREEVPPRSGAVGPDLSRFCLFCGEIMQRLRQHDGDRAEGRQGIYVTGANLHVFLRTLG